jgi:hypothetical protein
MVRHTAHLIQQILDGSDAPTWEPICLEALRLFTTGAVNPRSHAGSVGTIKSKVNREDTVMLSARYPIKDYPIYKSSPRSPIDNQQGNAVAEPQRP